MKKGHLYISDDLFSGSFPCRACPWLAGENGGHGESLWSCGG